MVKSLNAAQMWAGGIRDCLFKVQNWSSGHSCDLERVPLEYIAELLNNDPVPCNEPGHLMLKVVIINESFTLHTLLFSNGKHAHLTYLMQERADEAWRLAQEIDSALSSCSEVSPIQPSHSMQSLIS
jgi:histone demethylase JARID1